MAAGAEGQTGVNLYRDGVVGKVCASRVASVVYHYLFGNHDGLESFLLPLLVPVAVFSLAYIICNTGVVEGEAFEGCVQRRLVEERLLHVACQPVGGLLESLESCLSGQRRQQVLCVLRTGLNGE